MFRTTFILACLLISTASGLLGCGASQKNPTAAADPTPPPAPIVAVPAPTPALPKHGDGVDVASLKPGDALEVSESGRWWECTVVQVSDGQAKIRYVGWSEAWDEWVGPDRLRASSGKGTGKGHAVEADPRARYSNQRNGKLAAPPAAPAQRQAATPPAARHGDFVDVDALRPGDALEVSETGSWWECVVLEVIDGQIKVRYIGWDDSWNEWVAPERLRARTGKGNGRGGSIERDPRPAFPNKRNGNLAEPPGPRRHTQQLG